MRTPSKARPPRFDWTLRGQDDPTAPDQYRTACAHLFEIELHVADADFYNILESVNLAEAVFGRCRGVPQTFRRSRALTRQDGLDHVQVVVDQKGRWSGDYEGRKVSGDVGSIRFMEMSRPFEVRTDAYDTLNLMVPRTALDPAIANHDFHGLVLTDAAASARVLATHLQTLWAEIDDLSVDEASTAIRAAASMIGAVIRGHAEPRGVGIIPEQTLIARARAYIDARLASEDLAPEGLGDELAVSRTALYRAFKPFGGVSVFIQSRRLERAFDALTGQDGAPMTLSEIAYAHGFRSDAHFSRAFRARYGVPPGELRAFSRDRPPPKDIGPDAQAETVIAWVRTL